MLQKNPELRPSAREMLQDEWFKSFGLSPVVPTTGNYIGFQQMVSSGGQNADSTSRDKQIPNGTNTSRLNTTGSDRWGPGQTQNRNPAREDPYNSQHRAEQNRSREHIRQVPQQSQNYVQPSQIGSQKIVKPPIGTSNTKNVTDLNDRVDKILNQVNTLRSNSANLTKTSNLHSQIQQ